MSNPLVVTVKQKLYPVKDFRCTITGIMLKGLAILGLLLIVAPIVSGQPNKAADQKQSVGQSANPASISADATNKDNHAQTDQTNAGADPPERYAALKRPDWWLVIVAALTGGVICWQSRETRRAAKGAEKAAGAAQAQIKMMKDKERARISVEILPLDTLEFGTGNNRVFLRFKNFGYTHALNVRASGDARALIFSNPIHLPGLPRISLGPAYTTPAFDPLPFESEDLGIPAVILSGSDPTETWVGFVFPEPWRDEIGMRPKISIEVRGSVEYEDVFGDPHATTFSYDMRIPKWGEVSPDGSAPIRPYSPFSQWLQRRGEENQAT